MPFDYENYLHTNEPYFYSGFYIILVSIIVFEFSRRKSLALPVLIAGNLIMSGMLAHMQPFLHLWDEQVHALVAKNMSNHPFKPTLIDNPHIYYPYKNWLGNHIWLHKQPWFLWQIALFFKIFGVNYFVLRLPGIIMFSGLLLVIYRMGTVIKNRSTGFYAALMFAGSNFFYRLVTGAQATDHNDVAFVFYVTASIWAWLEFSRSDKKVWLVLTGIFSGIAILNKWLPGLLVYAGWFFSIILSKDSRKNTKNYLQLIYAFVITAAVALPWQIYILLRFPLESRHEFNLNSLHFFDAVEKHHGDYLYHINHLSDLYGTDFKYLILAGLISLFFIKIKKEYKIAMLTWIFTVYIFYSIAATKMLAFTFIVAPLVFITVSLFVNSVLDFLFKQKTNTRKVLKPIVTILVFGFFFINFLHIYDLILKNDKNTRLFYEEQIQNTLLYKKLPRILGDGEYEFFNCRNYDHIKVMFYTGWNANKFLPSQKQIEKLLQQNVTPVVFDNDKLPPYIVGNSNVIKIKSFVWSKRLIDSPEIYR